MSTFTYMPSTMRVDKLRVGDAIVIMVTTNQKYVRHERTDPDMIALFPGISYAFRVKKLNCCMVYNGPFYIA